MAKEVGSPGAGPAANAVRHHRRACIEAGSRRVVLCDIRPALQRSSGTIPRSSRFAMRPAALMYTRCIPRFPQLPEALKGPFNPVGMPAEQVLASGKPVVAGEADIDRYPNPNFRRFLALGFKSICSVPLIARDRVIGTLALNRMTDEAWTPEDVEFLLQVASQVAMTVSNSLAFRELGEIKERLATEKLYLEDEIRLDQNIGNMVGDGPGFQSVVSAIHTVAPTGATVLIMGETGTGKELVARAIHDLSGRSKGSFVKVNCAAIPASLLESELFGHEKGSFTGAVAQKIGRFELAHGRHAVSRRDRRNAAGTPTEAVTRHSGPGVRACRRQSHDPHGRSVGRRHKSGLEGDGGGEQVSRRPLLSPACFSIACSAVAGPPRRYTATDALLRPKHAQRMGRNIDTIPTSVLDALTNYDWPGNIRELQNVLERSVILTNGSVLQVPMTELIGKGTPVR